jgi:sugar lactone lactonase YvrE
MLLAAGCCPGLLKGQIYTPYAVATLVAPPGNGTSLLNLPYGVAADGAGTAYVADTANDAIERVTAGGTVTTFAGAVGAAGSADGPAGTARFNQPRGLAIDGAGNLYVADTGNDTIRRISPDGSVTTLAGAAGTAGSADGAGGAARFNQPSGVAVDGQGNVYVADAGNDTIRKITGAGLVTTVAGSAGTPGSANGLPAAARFNQPAGVAVDAAGNLYVADEANAAIREIAAGGAVTTLAGMAGSPGYQDGPWASARFNQPHGIAVDNAGNLYVADTEDGAIRLIRANGLVTTLAGAGETPGRFNGEGSTTNFTYPFGVAVDPAGNIYVADTYRDRISVGAAISNYYFTTLAGTAGTAVSFADGTGSAAGFNQPNGIALDGAGNLFVADYGNDTIRKIAPGGVVTTLAGSPGTAGSADGVGYNARFNQPSWVAVDGAGNVYVTDYANNTIRKVTSGGAVTTLAGLAGTTGSSDGTGSAARFNGPSGIAVDDAGNLYVAETFNCTIRMITPNGTVTTLAGKAGAIGSADGNGSAARFYYPGGVALDRAGNLYVADIGNDTIRKLSPAGVVTTLAGASGQSGTADGIGSTGRFSNPLSVAVDAAGRVFVADASNNTIREVTPVGQVVTVAGLPGAAGAFDGITPEFNQTAGVAVDPRTGALIVADANNNTIRLGTPIAIGTQPASQTVAAGSTAIVSAQAPGGAAVSYQWYRNGAQIAGANDPVLVLSANSASAGSYVCVLSADGGGLVSNPATLTVGGIAANPGRLVNLSVNSEAGGGGQILTVGFVTGGAGAAGQQSLLVRATGPALTTFGVAGVMPDPQLAIFNSGPTLVAANAGWGATPANAAAVAAAAALTYAFPLTDPTSKDSATVAALPPGNYTVQVSSGSGLSGRVLAEVYDATASGAYTPALPRLVNLSCQTQIAAAGTLTEGFVIGGSAAKTVLIRASGPALAAFKVAGAMPDPQLVVFDASSSVVAANAGWGGDPAIAAESAAVYAFPFTNSASHDSAALVTLAPGAYTAQASSSSGSAGVALIEVYEVP